MCIVVNLLPHHRLRRAPPGHTLRSHKARPSRQREKLQSCRRSGGAGADERDAPDLMSP